MEINHNTTEAKLLPPSDKLNEGCEDQMTIVGYKRSRLRLFLAVVAVVLSGGALAIVLAWKRSIRLRATHVTCSLEEADRVLLVDADKQEFVERVRTAKLKYQSESRHLVYFFNKKMKYVWDNATQQFYKVTGLNVGKACSFFHENIGSGLKMPVVRTRLEFYGANSVDVDVRSIPRLVVDEAVNPFYIYQVYTIILWSIQLYYQFAVGVVILSAISIIVSVWETRRQSIALRSAVYSHSDVVVVRDGTEQQIPSSGLVPGDVIVIPEYGYKLECDAVLVSGSCVVNESSLTGESIPVSKTPVPNSDQDQFTADGSFKQHVLFSGTEVLQTRNPTGGPVKAVVLKTGFCTSKGELVRAILYPKPVDLKFYSDFMRFFIIFIVLGLCAVVYSLIVWTINKATVGQIVLSSLDILTFVVPPILPAAYTSITAMSQKRLRKHGIFCLSSKYITLCGGLDLVCFDKTGTLTEDSLDLTTVIPVADRRFQKPLEDPTHLPMSPLLQAMATCHSLTWIQNHLSGYPLDVKIFEAIGWALEEPRNLPDNGSEKCSPVVVYPNHPPSNKADVVQKSIIVKKFSFESGLQRMTVVTRQVDQQEYRVYVKGAPEKIAALCSPNAVPPEFSYVLRSFTQHGFRVLAAAWKQLPEGLEWENVDAMAREDLEVDLEFAGLIVLQNLLKPETKPVLQLLNHANIRPVMVTGDNLLTAISVARECDMVRDQEDLVVVEAKIVSAASSTTERLELSFAKFASPSSNQTLFPSEINLQDCTKLNLEKHASHFAVDGSSFALIRSYDRKLLQQIVLGGTVFARMLPEQKIHLVETYQELGFQVGMCGDGANDCGALKVAHAGVSLCSAEASIASPFTSQTTNITCVPNLIREGRAALVSCVSVFKYEVAYSFSMLFMALMLFWVALKPTDPQYVYIDMILNIFPAITFGLTGPSSQLSRKRPHKKLMDIVPLTSIFSFLIIQLIFYASIWHYCLAQPWFTPYEFVPGKHDSSPKTYEGTAMFSISLYSYFMAALVFSEGPPFRKRLYANVPLTVFLVASFIASTIIVICPGEGLSYILSLKESPYIFYNVGIFGVAMINCFFCCIWELYVVRKFVARQVVPRIRQVRGPSLPHEHLSAALKKDETWPPIGTKAYQKRKQQKVDEVTPNEDAVEVQYQSELAS